jgi:hypothetical protein
MARGGGKRFEVCPKCGKKGFYVEHGWSMNPAGSMRCRYCYHTQLPDQVSILEVPDVPDTYFDRLDAALDTFQWAYQDREHNRGEIHLDREARDGAGELVMSIFVADTADESYDPQETPLVPLVGRYPVDTYKDPQAMIREAIHAYVCHEADEQMWFDNERIFDPHRESA